ncbi:unnamed protein product [Lupinus luteus]|uniref:Uncharacterized protein n=1 Tax=Lupinus luteus TaxID=3873 RepID=A0AAV1YHT7_LUPLU
MDSDNSINIPLLYLDPMCSDLNMLADAATGLHDEDATSPIPSLKIRFNMKTMKIVKEVAIDEPLKIQIHGSEEASNSMKPTNCNDDDEDLKGKSVAIINDPENEDWVPFKAPPNKSVASCSKKRRRYNVVVEAAPSELPQDFKDKISEMGGNETTLLISKSLFDSDLSEQQNRLSIPSKQIKNINFLREGELEDLEEGKSIVVKLIQPSLEVTNITLAKWNMRKNNDSISSSFVLRSSSWKKVIKDNQLQVDDRIQIKCNMKTVKEEASNSKKPINFVGSTNEEGATSNTELNFNDDDDDEDLLIKEKKTRALKGKSVAIINGVENGDVVDKDWSRLSHLQKNQ